MALDPQVRALLDVFADKPTLDQLPLEKGRRAFNETLLKMVPAPGVPVMAEDRRIDGPAGSLRVRVYRPEGDAAGRPLVLFFHGGGWVVLDVDTHDPMCRLIASAADAVVVSVDYRLAPEHRFPAAPDDCAAATRWAVREAASLGADPRRLVYAGDSAGGNLAAATALRMRDEGGPAAAGQVLIYPVTDHPLAGHPSQAAFSEGYGLTGGMMRWFWEHYLGRPIDSVAPDALPALAAPLRAPDLRGLPPALVMTAEYDVLRDEGEAYAARLREAGNDVTVDRREGMHHGFLSWTGVLDGADQAIERIGAWIASR